MVYLTILEIERDHYKSQSRIHLALAVVLVFLMIGGTFNCYAMIKNYGKMPVLKNVFLEEDKDYIGFTYEERNNINLWYFGDIFDLNFITKYFGCSIVISIGDLILYPGVFIGFVILLLAIKENIKFKRKLKNEEK